MILSFAYPYAFFTIHYKQIYSAILISVTNSNRSVGNMSLLSRGV